MAGMARARKISVIAIPLRVAATARLNTAMLLKWSPTSLTTWPIQV